jgi:hypothetical protein
MFEEIAKWFKDEIETSDDFNTPKPCNNIDLLYPPFRSVLEQLITEYQEEHETEPYVLETYRSNSLQQHYYDQGVSKIRTNGMHHYGIAADLVAKNGTKIDYGVLDYDWLRKRAVELGLTILTWELCHFQFISVDKQQTLRNEVAEA